MKKILSVFILLTFAACYNETANNNYSTPGAYSIRVIDGCEYIQVETSLKGTDSYNYTLTHKGNCKNPVHRCPCQGQ